MWEDGRGGPGGMDREHGRNGPGGGPGGPPPHGGQLHPLSASAGLQMSAGPGHMGGPVGLPMGAHPGQWAVPQQFVPGPAFMVPGAHRASSYHSWPCFKDFFTYQNFSVQLHFVVRVPLLSVPRILSLNLAGTPSEVCNELCLYKGLVWARRLAAAAADDVPAVPRSGPLPGAAGQRAGQPLQRWRDVCAQAPRHAPWGTGRAPGPDVCRPR